MQILGTEYIHNIVIKQLRGKKISIYVTYNVGDESNITVIFQKNLIKEIVAVSREWDDLRTGRWQLYLRVRYCGLLFSAIVSGPLHVKRESIRDVGSRSRDAGEESSEPVLGWPHSSAKSWVALSRQRPPRRQPNTPSLYKHPRKKVHVFPMIT